MEIAKRAWRIVRVIFFMIRKGISKSKLLVELNFLLKRGNKIASKAINNLLFHHHHHYPYDMSFSTPPREYEFSCSNTPNYSLPFHISKRRSHHHHSNFFGCAFQAPKTQDDDAATVKSVKLALEMLNNNSSSNYCNEPMVEEASPYLPGFGRSPMVRQLRITDSPFPLRDCEDDDNGYVDKKAEEFIEKFYKELRKQKKIMSP